MAATDVKVGQRPPSAEFIFCDDFRLEQNGKITLVGIYGAVLGVRSVPAILPRLVVAVRLSLPPEYSGTVVKLRVTDSGVQIAEAEVLVGEPPTIPGLEMPETQKRLSLSVPMEFLGFEVQHGALLVASAEIAGSVIESDPLSIVIVPPKVSSH